MENTKINRFMEEYKKLTEKHGVDFVSFPVFVPSDNGEFKVMVQITPVDLEEQQRLRRESFMKKNV